jgi:hypothetical protein
MKVLVLHPIPESFRTKNGGRIPRSENVVSFETAQEAIENCNESVHDASQVTLEFTGTTGYPRSKVKLREETLSKAGDEFLSPALSGLPSAPQTI